MYNRGWSEPPHTEDHQDVYKRQVVRRIFSLTLEGYGPYQIACKLSTDRIEIPVVHLARFNEGVNRSKPVKDPYGWGSSTIVNILKKREYLGHTINFKTRKHFKGGFTGAVAREPVYLPSEG